MFEAAEKELYQPILRWSLKQLECVVKRPLFIGLNAPQGAGKSTLTDYLTKNIENSVTLSIDDFYLTREDQVKLAAANHNVSYLQQRGYPGTHDIALGVTTLQKLKNGESIPLPRYDKSMNSGRGERAPEEDWPIAPDKIDIVFLEGWMLGFQPQESVSDDLEKVNSYLKEYSVWTDFLDAFISLKPSSPDFVIDWRIEAEKNMKAQGKSGMSEDEVKNYVSLFLPAYKAYEVQLKDPFLQIEIGKDRLPVSAIHLHD